MFLRTLTRSNDRPSTRHGRWTLIRSLAISGALLASTIAVGATTIAPASAASGSWSNYVDPVKNFPTWYGDSTGRRLDLCLDTTVNPATGAPNCLAAPTDLVSPDGEAFYFDAVAQAVAGSDTTANKCSVTSTAPCGILTLATEAAYAAPGVGQESVFNRTRIRVNVKDPGLYKVTWPYGSKQFSVSQTSTTKWEINDTVDLGCVASAPDNTCNDGKAPNFSDVTASLQPFLSWDSGAPAGFLGDAVTPHTITGGTNNWNTFRIEKDGVKLAETRFFVVQGKIAGPLEATPNQATLDTVSIGATTGSSVTLTLNNVSNSGMTVSAPTLTGANRGDFSISNNTCGALTAYPGKCTMVVNFKPTGGANGWRKANVQVTHNQALNKTVSIPVSGYARSAGTAPSVSLSATSLNFNDVHVGTESSQQIVRISNTGTAPLNVRKVALTGAYAGQFRLTADCTDRTLDLPSAAPANSCEVGVVYAPTQNADRTATLSITDDATGSPHTVTLNGTVQQGIVKAGPVDPATNFPAWYADANGQTLDNCVGGQFCLLTNPADLVAPAGEAFYFDGVAKMTIGPSNRPTRVVLTLATEAAYAGADPGQEMTFSRIRFSADKNLQDGATYTVTHPFGVDKYVASGGAVSKKVGTQDVGCVAAIPTAAAPCDWNLLTAGRVGPFLEWDTMTDRPEYNPATGKSPYIGDPGTNHRIKGGLKLDGVHEINVFRVEGPSVNPTPTIDRCQTLTAIDPTRTNADWANCVETDQFAIQGKIHQP